MKATQFIEELYKDFISYDYDFKYSVNFKNRNKQKFKHILIKNF